MARFIITQRADCIRSIRIFPNTMAQKCVLVFTKGKKRSTQPHCKYDEWKMMRYERSIQYDTIQYIEWAMMGCKEDQRILWIQREAVRNGGGRGEVQKGIIQFSCKSQSSVWNLFFSTNFFNVIRAINTQYALHVTGFAVFVSRPYRCRSKHKVSQAFYTFRFDNFCIKSHCMP